MIGPRPSWGQGDAASKPPQKNDVLVKRGDASLTPLTAADIPDSSTFVSAFPMTPDTKIVRRGTRLNEVLLVRVEPEGVLAFSALCTHAGCNIATWIPQEGTLSCDCHASEFDARASGKVIGGPASRPLPILALKKDSDLLIVDRPFAAPIRFDEQG